MLLSPLQRESPTIIHRSRVQGRIYRLDDKTQYKYRTIDSILPNNLIITANTSPTNSLQPTQRLIYERKKLSTSNRKTPQNFLQVSQKFDKKYLIDINKHQYLKKISIQSPIESPKTINSRTVTPFRRGLRILKLKTNKLLKKSSLQQNPKISRQQYLQSVKNIKHRLIFGRSIKPFPDHFYQSFNNRNS